MKPLLIIVGFVLALTILFQLNREKILLVKDRSGTNPADTKDLLLPDLKPTLPQQLYIESSPGVRKIRFSTTFINQGKGPLELKGQYNLRSGKTKATQRVVKTDGSFMESVVGEFVFHPGHKHWHTENYILFQLLSYKENGAPDKLLASTNKMSFCIWDEKEYDLKLANASSRQIYLGCNNETQGISVGWSDTYEADIEGQELEIGSLADGKYMVRSIINPDKNIMESDYSNNEISLYVDISGNTLTMRDNP